MTAREAPSVTGRYSRQELFAGIGPEGQAKIRAASVVVVGCGALGSALAEMMTRAGVGRLTLVDRDYVEESNLQRPVTRVQFYRLARPAIFAAATQSQVVEPSGIEPLSVEIRLAALLDVEPFTTPRAGGEQSDRISGPCEPPAGSNRIADHRRCSPNISGGEWTNRTPSLAATLVFETSCRPFSGTLRKLDDDDPSIALFLLPSF